MRYWMTSPSRGGDAQVRSSPYCTSDTPGRGGLRTLSLKPTSRPPGRSARKQARHWEYKGHRANLDAAFAQLRQYALALENPPLLIVSDLRRFRIRTNWTNSVSQTHEFDLDDLADHATRDRLKWAFSDPERLRPGVTRQALTERAAAAFASVAQALRARGHDPQAVAHFINRLVFCMFAADVGLLPTQMFTRMLQQARRTPAAFLALAGELFRVMATGGRVGFEAVDWFNGGLFDDDAALPLEQSEIETVLAASALDWSEIDPSILGTLFERGLDPGKHAQLGAHYTDRDKIMLIVEPVVMRPWLAKWDAAKAEIAAALDRSEAAKSPGARTRQRKAAEGQLRAFLDGLRAFTVLDPACGSGNFLYLALHVLKDLEHRVQLEAEALGFQRAFPEIGPANVKGIEINPYAAELARVSVWIGEIQWMRRNGFAEARNPILKPLDTIECRDAILTPDSAEPEWPEADVGFTAFLWKTPYPRGPRPLRAPRSYAAGWPANFPVGRPNPRQRPAQAAIQPVSDLHPDSLHSRASQGAVRLLRFVCGRLRKCKLFLRLVRAQTVRCCRVWTPPKMQAFSSAGSGTDGQVLSCVDASENASFFFGWFGHRRSGAVVCGRLRKCKLFLRLVRAQTVRCCRVWTPPKMQAFSSAGSGTDGQVLSCVDASENASFFFGWFGHRRSGAVVCGRLRKCKLFLRLVRAQTVRCCRVWTPPKMQAFSSAGSGTDGQVLSCVDASENASFFFGWFGHRRSGAVVCGRLRKCKLFLRLVRAQTVRCCRVWTPPKMQAFSSAGSGTDGQVLSCVRPR